MVLLSVGLILKDQKQGHCSSFQELALGLFPTESSTSFQALFEALISTVKHCANLDIRFRVVQVHGDWADGIRVALEACFPQAKRSFGLVWFCLSSVHVFCYHVNQILCSMWQGY